MKKRSLLAVSLISALPAVSFANNTASTVFDAAITSVSADVTSWAGSLVGVAVIGVGFMIAIKYIKKIARAA